LFNVSTFAATRDALTLAQEREWIWAPNAGGSVRFLVASWLAYMEVSPRPVHPPRRDLGMFIAAMNLGGSLAFGASPIGARYVATTDEPANPTLVNAGTFAGAVLFFLAAALLPVESSTDRVHEHPADSLTSVTPGAAAEQRGARRHLSLPNAPPAPWG